jgi:mannose-6-phosphate isomerase
MKDVFRRPFKLNNKIQHYDWGTKNDNAFIPRFLGIPAVRDLPYAELWIGAHPTAPSEIEIGGQSVPLNQAIEAHPLEILGGEAVRRFGARLPFLLKVLSAAGPLSIQTHPNKDQAKKLHAADPAHYPDENHKPEIAIALDGLAAVVGFRPANHLVALISQYPELSELVGSDRIAQLAASHTTAAAEQNLIELYEAIMRGGADRQLLGHVVSRIAARLSGTGSLSEEQQYFVEQHRIHGADAGLFSFLLYNLVHLEPGQAIFTDAGIPHAYLKGNIVECMANSDNVVRAGLTTKFTDIDALLDILQYRFEAPEIINSEAKVDGVVYRTSAEEFEVSRTTREKGIDSIIEGGESVSVILVTDGSLRVEWEEGGSKVLDCSQGESILIPAALKEWRAYSAGSVEYFTVNVPHSTER